MQSLFTFMIIHFPFSRFLDSYDNTIFSACQKVWSLGGFNRFQA